MAAPHPDDPAPGPDHAPTGADEGDDAEAGGADEAVEESPAAGVLDPDRAEPPEPSEPG
jgi:hypothetical protein